MNLVQLAGRYVRLRQELSRAYGEEPPHVGRIRRIARDLAATEREIVRLRTVNLGSPSELPDLTLADGSPEDQPALPNPARHAGTVNASRGSKHH